MPDTVLDDVLDVQRDLILSADAVPHLADLADIYDIRDVYIVEPTVDVLAEVCRLFDCEDVFCAGIAPESDQNAYWQSLAELRIQVRDV